MARFHPFFYVNKISVLQHLFCGLPGSAYVFLIDTQQVVSEVLKKSNLLLQIIWVFFNRISSRYINFISLSSFFVLKKFTILFHYHLSGVIKKNS